MASLTGKAPSATYKDLLQVSNSNAGIDATLRDLEDGEGTVGPFKLSTTGARLQATATLDGASGATLDMTNITGTRMKSWTQLATSSPTSGTTVTMTGIPTTAKIIMVVWADMNYSGADRMHLRVQDNGVTQTSGYYATSVHRDNTATPSAAVSTTQLHLLRVDTNGSSEVQSGVGFLHRNGSTGKWIWSSTGRQNDSGTPTNFTHGIANGQTPTIATALDGLVFTIVGASTFSAGTITVYYQE